MTPKPRRRSRRARGLRANTSAGMLILVAVVVGAACVVGGFMIGRSSGDGEVTEATPAEATPADATPSATTQSPPPAPVIEGPTVPVTAGPSVVFDPPSIEFGTVGPDTELTDTFTMRNISRAPLTVRAMKPSCKCTTVQDLTGTVLEPGESVEITAVMEKRSYPGPRNSKIDFVFDDGTQAQFLIKSNVSLAVQAVPAYVDAVNQTSGVYIVRAMDDKPFRVLGVNGKAPRWADGFEPGDSPQTEYRLQWDLAGYDTSRCQSADGERMRRWWVIETDHPDVPVLDMRLRHNPCTRLEMPTAGRRWFLSENRMVLGAFEPGESKDFDLNFKWLPGRVDPTATIESIICRSAQFDAELLNVSRTGGDVTIQVRITAKRGHEGLIYDEIRLVGNNPDQSQGLTIIGRIPIPGRG